MIFIFFLSLIFTFPGFAQENVKIVTYNVLEYSGSDTAVRHPHFRKVIHYAAPDILVIEEIHSQQAMNMFLNGVMNVYGNIYSMGTFINGPDTDNGIFYKTSKFVFVSNTRIITQFRDINEFKLVHINYPNDTLRIFAVHLYPGSGATNEGRRAAEVDSLRKYTLSLPQNSFYMVVGDFNITGSNEQAYIKLIQSGNGQFFDLLPYMPGIWDNISYAPYHTMSSRTRSFGGGSTGGLRNRFDMILLSQSIYNSGRIAYLPNTLTHYGNDGNHYRDSVNRRPNNAVPDSIADALHYSSDHIPVFATFTFGNIVGFSNNHNCISEDFYLFQNYPNPFNPITRIDFSIPRLDFVKLTIFDFLGREVEVLVNLVLQKGFHSVQWDSEGYPSGVYFYRLEASGLNRARRLVVLK